MRSTVPWFSMLLSLALCLSGGSVAAGPQEGQATPPRQVPVPADDVGANLLAARGRAQKAAAANLALRHDFRFVDRLEESGITFLHRAVDDAARSYKAVHYDHGNGIAAADVDGDGLHDLYFVNQLGPNQLFKNLGEGRFRDVTEEAGVALGDRVCVSASFADVDGDGDADLYVTAVRQGNKLFVNDGRGRFSDRTREAGLDYAGHSSSAVFFDYDLDGQLDLFLVNVGRYTTDKVGPGDYYVAFEDAFDGHLDDTRTERSVLYRNLGGGRFSDVSAAVGLLDGSWSGDAAFADLTGDRHPDLYVLNMQGDDHYYENMDGRRFVDRTAEVFPRTPWGSMGIKVFDWNNDDRLDLLLTDMHSDMSERVMPHSEKLKSEMKWTDEYLQGGGNNIFGNALWEGQGEGRFREISDLVGVENYWPWGVSVGDLNADGFDDLLITASMSYPFRYGLNSLLLNDRGKTFHDSEFLVGLEPRRDGLTRIPYFELDCSGADGQHADCADQEGSILVMGTIGTRSAVMLDLDGDGDLDVVTNEFHSRPQVLVSDLAQRHPVRFLKIELEGTSSNRDGLGALVRVSAGGAVRTRLHDHRSGYLSQSSLPLYFGLGEAKAVEWVEVEWPSGRRQRVAPPPAPNSLVVVREEEKVDGGER